MQQFCYSVVATIDNATLRYLILASMTRLNKKSVFPSGLKCRFDTILNGNGTGDKISAYDGGRLLQKF